MTVSTTTNKIVYVATGLNGTFTFPFAVNAISGVTDIEVFQTDTSGNITQLTEGTQYTVVLNAAIAPNPTPVGGTVTLTSIPSLGTLVTILRSMALTQTSSLANQGNLYQPVLESTDDNQAMQLQQISELQGRALTVAVSDSAPTNLPPAVQRANLILGFDASGNPTAVAAAPTGVISSAMAPFVGSSTLAAAKALLGYGSMANENIGVAGKGIADDGAGNVRVGWTVSAVSSNQSVGTSNHMTAYISSGTLTYTLAKLTALFNGFEIEVYCLTNSATLSPNAADTIQGFSSGAGVVITAGQVAKLIGDGTGTWYLSVRRFFGVGTGQTLQSFATAGSGTYTTPKGCTRIKVRMIGAGSGGSGSVTSGGNGGDTIFNSVHAAGSLAANGYGGTGGSGVANLRIPGGNGNISSGQPAAGGNGAFGGNGINNNGSQNLVPGAGGLGGSGQQGGGAGEYVELIINLPTATYSYTVGAAGAAGTGVGSILAGSPGLIIVDEFYD